MLWIIHPSSSLLSSSLNEIPSAAQCIHHTRRTQHTLFLSLSRARSLSIYPCGVSTNRNHRLMTRWSSSSLQSHLKTLSTFSIPHHGACMRSAIASLRWQCAAISFWPPVPFAESNCKISWLQSVHGASSTDWTQTKYIYIAFSFCVRLSICLWPQHIQPNYSITYQLSKTLENRKKKHKRTLVPILSDACVPVHKFSSHYWWLCRVCVYFFLHILVYIACVLWTNLIIVQLK